MIINAVMAHLINNSFDVVQILTQQEIPYC